MKVISVTASAAADSAEVSDSVEVSDPADVPDLSGAVSVGASTADCADCDDCADSAAEEPVSAVSCAAAAVPGAVGVCMDSVRELSVVTVSAPGCPEDIPVQPAVSRSIGTSRSTGISRAAAGKGRDSALPVQCLRRFIFAAGTLSVRVSVLRLYMGLFFMIVGEFRFSGQ